MKENRSVRFFEAQFEKQVREADLHLNPFEQIALPYLSGRLLDYGCGLGNLAVAAARRGCSVVALDASHTAIEHLRQAARQEALPIEANEADLRTYEASGQFDSVVSIGLLMFFDCGTAMRRLQRLMSLVRPGGVAVVNVLEEGTTYLDMFDPGEHCLFARGQIEARFAGWEVLHCSHPTFPAPNGQLKSFVTVVARRPAERI